MRYLLSTTALLLLAVPAAQAQVFPETKLTASDGTGSDLFGSSVAISDGTVIVGSPGDDDGPRNSGSAYLFDLATGTETKLTASDRGLEDRFGTSVAISGGTAIVGSPDDDDDGSFSGSAYLFDVGTGAETKLTASDGQGSDRFGTAVSISNDTAFIGTFRPGRGSAYLFDVPTGTESKLSASDGADLDRFGAAVAISGGAAIVGSPGDRDNGNFSGSAYLFDLTTGTETKLTASDVERLDRFGSSVAISGGAAIIGAIGDNDNGTNSGSAYLFDIATGTETKLTASDAAASDEFGNAVAISGRVAVVGAYENAENGNLSGSAYLFDVASGRQVAKLTASDGAALDRFGSSVAIDGTTVVVGARGNGNPVRTGAAYVFDLTPRWNAPFGGSYDSAANWAGLAPSRIDGFDTFINPDMSQTIFGPSRASEAGAVELGFGAGFATLSMRAGGGIIAADGMEIGRNGRLQGSGGIAGDIRNQGEIGLDGLALTGDIVNENLVEGEGRVGGDLTSIPGGEIRLGEGDRLTVMGNFTNDGVVNALGATVPGADPTSLDVRGVSNSRGDIRFIGGRSTIFGAMSNLPGGQVLNGGGGELILFDLFVNAGDLATGVGSTTIMAGDYVGPGSTSGGGTLIFEGGVSTGASPGLIDFGNDISLADTSVTEMELAGRLRGTEYDAWDVTGTLTLGGTLDLVHLEGFMANAGDSFTLFTATDGITGSFGSINYAPLGSGLWTEVRTANSYGFAVTPTAAPIPLPAGVWLLASGLGLLFVRRRA